MSNTNESLKRLMEQYKDIAFEYYRLSTRDILSETEAKKLGHILEAASNNEELSLLLNEIDESIFQEDDSFSLENLSNYQNERSRALELTGGNILPRKTIFENSKLNLETYKNSVEEYHRLVNLKYISELDERRMEKILEQFHQDELSLFLANIIEYITFEAEALGQGEFQECLQQIEKARRKIEAIQYGQESEGSFEKTEQPAASLIAKTTGRNIKQIRWNFSSRIVAACVLTGLTIPCIRSLNIQPKTSTAQSDYKNSIEEIKDKAENTDEILIEERENIEEFQDSLDELQNSYGMHNNPNFDRASELDIRQDLNMNSSINTEEKKVEFEEYLPQILPSQIQEWQHEIHKQLMHQQMFNSNDETPSLNPQLPLNEAEQQTDDEKIRWANPQSPLEQNEEQTDKKEEPTPLLNDGFLNSITASNGENEASVIIEEIIISPRNELYQTNNPEKEENVDLNYEQIAYPVQSIDTNLEPSPDENEGETYATGPYRNRIPFPSTIRSGGGIIDFSQEENRNGALVAYSPTVTTINGNQFIIDGGTNLFLMNPAGIIFGDRARLNVPGSFTATTATEIGFENDHWFNAVGSNDYSTLEGTPTSFAIPDSLINSGDLAVTSGESLMLFGGTVINTGSLAASGGEITIAAIEGENWGRIGQENSLLTLELETTTDAIANGGTLPNALPFTPLTLPSLLTGHPPTHHATDLVVNADGSISLTTSPEHTIPTVPGVAIASNNLSVSTPSPHHPITPPPEINVLGDRPLLNATLSTDNPTNGGTILIGGGFQGQESVFNASQTLVDGRSSIAADSLENGDGGWVIVWADGETGFWGDISATGGGVAGDGGFVEVSGKQQLIFDGTVDVSAANSLIGELLLNPADIIITDGDVGANDLDFLNGTLPDDGVATISEETLEGLASNADITLTATNDITVEDLNDDVLALPTISGAEVEFIADSDNEGAGSFSMNTGDAIQTQGGSIRITGADIVLGNVPFSGGLNLTSTVGDVETGITALHQDISITAQTDIMTGNINVSEIKRGQTSSDAGNITLTATTSDITIDQLSAISSVIGAGNAGNGGDITLDTLDGNITTNIIPTISHVGSDPTWGPTTKMTTRYHSGLKPL